MDNAAYILWIILFLASIVLPLRWGLVAYLCLTTIDFETGRFGIGGLNAVKATAVPVWLLWRMRAFSGHISLPMAPIAWLLLACYVEVASAWSFFPNSAHKLVVQMLATFLIVCVYTRATKAEYVTAETAVWAGVGCVIIGILRHLLAPGYGDDPARFTGFVPAQPFAALLAASYCIALCGKGLRTPVRVFTCSVLAGAIVLNGSRMWFAGILVATLLNLVLSREKAWLKVCASAAVIALITVMVGASDAVFGLLATNADSNRIAAAITALHRGDRHSFGLGTLNFREQINRNAIEQLENSTARQLIFGRGSCNGAMIGATLFPDLYPTIVDPNRMMHNEWLRVIYEWGLIGSFLWIILLGSIVKYTFKGLRLDPNGNAKPLLLYLPAFFFGITGENTIAGAASPANMGFIFVLSLSTMPHRDFWRWKLARRMRARLFFKHRIEVFRAAAGLGHPLPSSPE